MPSYLVHHGILGQKWGDQNGPPYPLSNAQRSAQERRENRWIKKKSAKIQQKAYTQSKKELRAYDKELRKDPTSYLSRGKMSRTYVNRYNQKMAELMSERVSDLTTPTGKTVQFVAKRGSVGVYMALADKGYDMSQLSRGVWSSGKVAYKKSNVDMV